MGFSRRKRNRLYWLLHKKEKQEYAKVFNDKRRGIMTALKNKPCADCFQWFDPCQMDWDHREGVTKFKEVAKLGRHTLEKLLTEISKCDLVCANCHRLRTYKRGYKNV